MRSALVFFVIAFSVSGLQASGARVTLRLRTETLITGELLLLSDSMLVIASSAGLPEDRLRTDTGGLRSVRLAEIEHFVFCGHSYVADGMLLGIVGGVAIGALVAYSPEGHNTDNVSTLDPTGPGAEAMIVGLVAGAALGAFFGGTSSTDDTELSEPVWRRIPFLRGLTRYHDRATPEFLQAYLAQRTLRLQP